MVPPLHTKKILIKKCFIDQKGLKAASIYSHCTSDPRNPYHNLLAPVTRTAQSSIGLTSPDLYGQTTQSVENYVHPVSLNSNSKQLATTGKSEKHSHALALWTDSSREGF